MVPPPSAPPKDKKDLQIEGNCRLDVFLWVHQAVGEQVFSSKEAAQVDKHLKYPAGMGASRKEKSKWCTVS